jgi:Ca-activated chloride channel family protein
MSTMSGVGFIPHVQGRKEPLSLAMQSLWLTGRVLPMGARLWVRHEFQSQESRPVEVVYGFVLPRDATLRRFRVQGDGFSVASELRPTDEARKAYENGIQAGSLSTLAREYGDGLINLSLGNLRPQEKVVVLLELIAGVELHDDGLRLRFPFTLAPSYHAQMRALEVEPGRGEIELPQEEFDDLILPTFVNNAGSLHSAGFSLEVRVGEGLQEIASPSHTLKVETIESCTRVSLARESDVPDRDLVLDIRKKGTGTSVFSGVDGKGKGRFAVVVPSTEFGEKPTRSRRLVILLDRSGSMDGTPLARAKKAIEACLASLDESDLFGLVAFDNEVESFSSTLEAATKTIRERARDFLDKIGARGGTELAKGVESAATLLNSGSSLRPAGTESGDVFILTDGQVFGTEVILERARAAKARVHCLGIGSASQDRFLAHLATHTGGVSRFVTPRERVDMAALELFSAIGLPVAESVHASVTGVEGARLVSEVPKLVFAGTPLLLNGETPSSGNAALHVEWNNQDTARQFDLSLPLTADPISETLKLFQGAKIISDYESRLNHSPQSGAAERREDKRIQETLVRLSEDYSLASSQMSLVSVVKRAGDIAGELPKVVVVPVGMNEDTAFTALFACGSAVPTPQAAAAPLRSMRNSFTSLFSARQPGLRDALCSMSVASEPRNTRDDILVAVAGRLEPDGGLPGKTPIARITNSLAVLLFLLAEGNSESSGPLQRHVAKLMRFLEIQELQILGAPQEAIATRAIRTTKQYSFPEFDWRPFVEQFLNSGEIDQVRFWRELENTIRSNAGIAP